MPLHSQLTDSEGTDVYGVQDNSFIINTTIKENKFFCFLEIQSNFRSLEILCFCAPLV